MNLHKPFEQAGKTMKQSLRGLARDLRTALMIDERNPIPELRWWERAAERCFGRLLQKQRILIRRDYQFEIESAKLELQEELANGLHHRQKLISANGESIQALQNELAESEQRWEQNRYRIEQIEQGNATPGMYRIFDTDTFRQQVRRVLSDALKSNNPGEEM